MRTLILTLLLVGTAHAEPNIVVTTPMTTQQTVITESGTYIVIPNYATGGVMAVVKTADGKNDDKDD